MAMGDDGRRALQYVDLQVQVLFLLLIITARLYAHSARCTLFSCLCELFVLFLSTPPPPGT
jgi:hypothetical protein